ncbi:MAG: hypothetical protein GF353_21580 [Candidatus Lokiarchaeota archaeon]|nr:hypothetical protein [Candidatus Lokiarchaeota archaeon]
MSEKKEENFKKDHSAKDTAEAMAANMKANMENPNFIEEQELLKDEVRREVLKKRREILKNKL